MNAAPTDLDMRGQKTGGRTNGTPNKVNITARENIIAAFGGIGGIPALVEWAKANKTVGADVEWTRLGPLCRLSSGPRTVEGKARASRNAWKGGHWLMLRELTRQVNAEVRAARDLIDWVT